MKNFLLLLSAIFMSFSISFSQNLSENLLIYYSFDGGSLDYSGNEFHGIPNATLTTDRNCNLYSAYSFNGIDQYIDFPNESSLKPDLPVSFSFWIKFDDLSAKYGVIFTTDFEQNNHSGVWMGLSSTGYLSINYGDASGNTSLNSRRSKIGTTKIASAVWYHIVGIAKGPTDMNIYINGVNDGGTYVGHGGSLTYTTNPGSIGRKDADVHLPSYYFKGTIDEFRYWNREITEKEVEELYNPKNGLLIYYPFNGNSIDESGNENHGIANATLTQDRLCNENSAYSFNGFNEYIDLPNNIELKPELPVSFTYWVKFDDLSPQKSVLFTTDYTQDNHTGVWMNLSSGKLVVSYGDASGNTSPNSRRSKIANTVLDTMRWYHIAAIVRGPEDMDIYVNCMNDNGIYEGFGGNLEYGGMPGSIGRKDIATVSPYYFDGKFDEFKYYNREISVHDIFKDYFSSQCSQNIQIYDTVHVSVIDTTYITLYDSISVTDTLFIDIPRYNGDDFNHRIKVYPNPTKNFVYISIEDYELIKRYKMEITRNSGQVVYETFINSSEFRVSISQFGSKGLYFLNIRDETGNIIQVKKIILY